MSPLACSEPLIDVLSIEDNESDRYLIREVCQHSRRKIQLQFVPTGEEGIGRLEQARRLSHYPNVILLDLNLPGQSGWEVLAELKRRPELKEIPVILVTTSSLPEDSARARQMGADVFFSKPLDLDAFYSLATIIESIFESHSGSTDSAND